jgi:hypothetical protein
MQENKQMRTVLAFLVFAAVTSLTNMEIKVEDSSGSGSSGLIRKRTIQVALVNCDHMI